MADQYRVLVVGCGTMGGSHAPAYRIIEGVEIAGLVSRSPDSRERLAQELGGNLALFASYEEALRTVQPDVVSINTYSDMHARYAIQALNPARMYFWKNPSRLLPRMLCAFYRDRTRMRSST